MKPLVLFGLLLIFLTGCSIKTPEIQGVVLDEKTKEPVEGAWITSTLGIKTKTFGGDVHSYYSIDPPHTRTDKNGRFIIPSKSISTGLVPAGLATEVENLSINASTIDDKTDGFYLKDYDKSQIDLTLHVRPWEKGLKDELEYFSYLQSLYSYCTTGRFGIEVPRGIKGCDAWELDFSITQHEGFLKRLGEPKTAEQETRYKGTLYQLAYLHQRRGDYRKALDTFVTVRDFDKKRGVTLWLKEYEARIKELEQKLEAK